MNIKKCSFAFAFVYICSFLFSTFVGISYAASSTTIEDTATAQTVDTASKSAQIEQSNSASIVNTIKVTVNTGNNVLNNTNGSSAITTGDAHVSSNITNDANNAINNSSCCQDAKNKVTINNVIEQKSTTGNNSAIGTTGDVTVMTGDATASVRIANSINSSATVREETKNPTSSTVDTTDASHSAAIIGGTTTTVAQNTKSASITTSGDSANIVADNVSTVRTTMPIETPTDPDDTIALTISSNNEKAPSVSSANRELPTQAVLGITHRNMDIGSVLQIIVLSLLFVLGSWYVQMRYQRLPYITQARVRRRRNALFSFSYLQ